MLATHPAAPSDQFLLDAYSTTVSSVADAVGPAVAMVALETVGPVSPEALAEAVSRAMARDAIVEVHNEQTMVVKLVEN